jgi:drug/metabolite transporter (DMT)-like permease
VAEPATDRARSKPWLGLAIGVSAASTGSIFVRLAQGEGAPTLSIAAWRLVFACAVLLPYIAVRARAELRMLTRREWLLLACSGVFLGLHFATWIGSLAYTSVASSVVLVSTGPLFVGLGSWLILRERPSGGLVLGLTVSLVGSTVIGWGDFRAGNNVLLGDLLALTGAVMVAGYLMVGRKIRARRSLLVYIGPVYAVAMLTLLATSVLFRSPLAGLAPRAYLWMLLLGLVPQILGHSSLNWALRHLSATHVSMATLAEPVGTVVLAWALLGEAPKVATVAGGAVTLLGIAIAARTGGGMSLAQVPPAGYTPGVDEDGREVSS